MLVIPFTFMGQGFTFAYGIDNGVLFVEMLTQKQWGAVVKKELGL